MKALIVLVDLKQSRGGGQVVAEELLRRLPGDGAVGLVMPSAGRATIAIPAGTQVFDGMEELLQQTAGEREILLCCNANAALPVVWRAAQRLRARGVRTHTVAIIHNYASSPAKGTATRILARRMDDVVIVEPGLAQVAPPTRATAWLGLIEPPPPLPASFAPTGVVKAYARPDPSKGLHLLPPALAAIEKLGLRCEVALGSPLEAHASYQRQLRQELAPWLVEGARTAAWVEPGDIFLIASVSGEAACLAAQEVIARGAFLVASHIGVIPYLSPTGRGVRTVAIGDAPGLAHAVAAVAGLAEAEFVAQCRDAYAAVSGRVGLWYQQVSEFLVTTAGDLSHSYP